MPDKFRNNAEISKFVTRLRISAADAKISGPAMHQAPGPIHFPKRLLPFPTAFQSSFSKVPTRQSSREQAAGEERGHRRQSGRDQVQQAGISERDETKKPRDDGAFFVGPLSRQLAFVAL